MSRIISSFSYASALLLLSQQFQKRQKPKKGKKRLSILWHWSWSTFSWKSPWRVISLNWGINSGAKFWSKSEKNYGCPSRLGWAAVTQNSTKWTHTSLIFERPQNSDLIAFLRIHFSAAQFDSKDITETFLRVGKLNTSSVALGGQIRDEIARLSRVSCIPN